MASTTMKPEFQINLLGETSAEIIVREGKALELREPLELSIAGVLDSPLRWLEKRIADIDQTKAHILVDRQAMRITLDILEQDYFGPTISGKLELHPLFKKFAINTDSYLSNFDMAKLFKMNRSAFESLTIAMSLVSTLQNFQAKVNKEIEKLNDNRGNTRDLKAQAVTSNLPDTFTLVMPIFKGTAKQTFPVEVDINADNFSCTLVSPVANDLIEEMRDSEIDAVLEAIRELAPNIAIIEQ